MIKMKTLELSKVTREGFSLDPSLDDGNLSVRFSGNGDMSAVTALGLFLRTVHEEATKLAVSQVSFDFSALYFMNSSCFKAFVTWIHTVSQSTPPAYGICFLTNPKLYWQRRSLEALRCLAPKVVRVESLGG